jgi:hypothetical protein
MGAAVWRGPALRDILKACGVRPEAVEVWLGGADKPVLDATPPSAKASQSSGDGSRYHRGDRHEQYAPSATERISGAFDCPRLGRHLLDEASYHDRGQHEAAGQFLDEECLSRSSRLFPVDHPFKSQATEVSVPITAPIDDETAAEIIAYLASNYAVTKKP